MAATKSTNTRLPAIAGSASKCFRYTHARSQADGSQSCQDSGVTAAKALSSNPGRSLPAEAGPKRQPAPNERTITRAARRGPPASAASRAGPRR
jgi:hypothetical protein